MFVLSAVTNSFVQSQPTQAFLPLDEIKPGMKGVGRTVFSGNAVEDFEVEIIGVLRNIQPKRNVVLARLSGPVIDDAGVVQGMSGSPVYIDGKLIGAVAYSYGTFTKEPIAGITPIEEMLSESKQEPSSASFSSFSASIPIRKHMSMEEIFELNGSLRPTGTSSTEGGRMVTPLTVPLVMSGFSSPVFERVRESFTRMGFRPVLSGSAVQAAEPIAFPDMSLKAGDPVGVQMMRGDLDMTAIGTVTYVDGNRVLAFGHPMYSLGPVEYAMTKAKVMAVIPSLAVSFKVALTDITVGRFVQDRNSGVYGELGKQPRFIPLNISVLGHQGQVRDFRVEVTSDKILTPALVDVAVSGVLSSEERAFGDLTLDFSADIYLENGQSVHLEDLFSGNYNTSVTNLSTLLASVVYFLTNNEFKDLDIHRIDLKARSREEIMYSYLDTVWLDKYDVSPGERIDIRLYVRNAQGESQSIDIPPFPAPSLPSGSEFYLVIGDAAAMRAVEMSQYRVQQFVPRSLYQLIRILSNLRKNNRIYFKVFASKPGLFLKGEEMPNLPPTMKSMFSSPRAASSNPTELTRSTLGEYQLPIESVFQGSAVIPIKIK